MPTVRRNGLEEVVLAAAIDTITTFWRKELGQLPGTFAMVHSKRCMNFS